MASSQTSSRRDFAASNRSSSPAAPIARIEPVTSPPADRPEHESAVDRVTDQSVGAGLDERRSGDRSRERAQAGPQVPDAPPGHATTDDDRHDPDDRDGRSPGSNGPVPDHVAQAGGGDDREQHDLGDDPTLTTGTECWESGAHRQMLPTLKVTASGHSSTGTISGPARSRSPGDSRSTHRDTWMFCGVESECAATSPDSLAIPLVRMTLLGMFA
jgi:hypothetical protein